MKRFFICLVVGILTVSVAGFLAAGCPESDPDSVELGCRTDSDCFGPGEPRRWCQRETGICVAFTTEPGDTTQQDAAVQPPADAGP